MILGLLAALLGSVEAAWAGSDPIERAPTDAVDAVFGHGAELPSDVSDRLDLQAASSVQEAIAAALATQETPTNASLVVRLLSPGTHAALEQQNANQVGAESANQSSIAQEATQKVTASEPEQYQQGDITQDQAKNGDLSREELPSVSQSAVHDQSGEAEAVALQLAPANIYISVRVLSPGDSGPVIQVNGNSATSTAANAAGTDQIAESPQESGLDEPLIEQRPTDDPASVGSDSGDKIDAHQHPADVLDGGPTAQDPAATSVSSDASETEAPVDVDQPSTPEPEQYYALPDQYQDLIPDVLSDISLEVLVDRDLEVPIDIDQVLGLISSWNWEGLAGQVVESIPASDRGVLMTGVDEVVGELLGDLVVPVAVADESDEAPTRPPEPKLTAEKTGDSESARPESPREPSVVVKPASADGPATAVASAKSGEAATEDGGDQIVPMISQEQSIVLVELDTPVAEPRAAQSRLPRIGFPPLPSELLTHGGTMGSGGSASPPAVLPTGMVGLAAAGIFLLLHLAFSIWRARGLVLPLERPG